MSEPTKEEMLNAVEFYIPEYSRLPGMVCPGKILKDVIRTLIEKVFEWQTQAEDMVRNEYIDSPKIYGFLEEIRDFGKEGK
jgi:hypothetical protein